MIHNVLPSENFVRVSGASFCFVSGVLFCFSRVSVGV